MTVSSSVGREKTIAQHIALAYHTAGIYEASQQPKEADQGLGRELLENIVDSLQTYAVQARAVSFYNLQLTAGQYIYTLPDNVLDVDQTIMYIDPGQPVDAADGETPLYPMLRNEWQVLATKGSKGRPVKYYVHRDQTPPELYIWQSPDQAGTLRIPIIRLLADTDDDGATLDLQRYWGKYIQYALAAAICEAKSQSLQRVGFFEQKSRVELEHALSTANEKPGNQIHIDHGQRSSWGRMSRR